jgi:hypothetical protein
MTDQDNHEDRLADQNLRLIGRHLKLPPDPTQRQQSAWKKTTDVARPADHTAGPPLSQRGASFMKRHRSLTLATSAAAATIVIAVLFSTPRGAVVEASTIFNSLRQTLLDGFQLTLSDIGEDGVRVDGEILVTLKPREDGGVQVSDQFDPALLQAESFYFDVSARADESSEELAGLDIQMTMALNEQNQWMYFKMLGLPEELLEQEPMAWAVVGMASSGVLIQMDGLVGDWGEILYFESEDDEATDPKGTATASISVKTEPGDDHQALTATAGGTFEPKLSLTGDGEIERLLRDFLTGRATGEQIDEFYALIAEAAEDVSVDEDPDGRYVLTARDFKLDEADEEDAAMVGAMILQIVYREGTGIESASLENVGEYGGTLRLAPISGGIDASLFDQERVIEPGVTKVWDLSSLAPLIQESLRGED